MDDDRERAEQYDIPIEWVEADQVTRRREREELLRQIASGYSYEMKLGRQTIKLAPIEFNILRFLASQPYRAFSRRSIAQAVSTRQQPVTPDSLDAHVARLRDALGFFSDYIQTVPDIGYRFRA